MIFIYNIFIFSYDLLIKLAAIIGNEKAKKRVDGLKMKLPKMSKLIWCHCASLGEYEQALPVLEGLKAKHPENNIAVSFFSSSGYENAKRSGIVDHFFYLPIDNKRKVENLLNYLDPEMVVFVKYEFWFHYIDQLVKRKIPTFFISVSLRKNHFLFNWYGSFISDRLKLVSQIFVQDDVIKSLLEANGFSNVINAGDTRFDRVLKIRDTEKYLQKILTFKDDDTLLVLGSSWPKEEQILKEYLSNSAVNNLKVIITPHDISEEHIEDIETKFSGITVRYSEYIDQKRDIMIIDNIGLLSSIYKYSDIAFVGGGFANALHNILEPAVYGTPVIYGNDCEKYPEAKHLAKACGGFMVGSQQEFNDTLDRLIKDEVERNLVGKCSLKFIESNSGATRKILEYL